VYWYFHAGEQLPLGQEFERWALTGKHLKIGITLMSINTQASHGLGTADLYPLARTTYSEQKP
jgi:hypothetical protein